MQPPVHEYQVLIREQHLDTFGHVNNAKYLELFEEARWDWITAGGYGLREVVERQLGPTILDCHLTFRRELKNREPVLIRSWVESYVGKIGVVRQELLKRDGNLSCAATFKMALFDLAKRQLVDPTPEWLACVGWTLQDWKSA